MFASKFFLLMILLALFAMCGTLYFQIGEMQQYELMNTIMERYFKSAKPTVVPEVSKSVPDKTDKKVEKAKKTE
ncbi:hypothetical protein P0136_11595 [Lentisphaerota bacterium ZTH]|nr:hypothetical protein JYG24_10885 [Lentisphaerota bacterium]WET06001.1 hypothetical protein P0136_11595 [Lentisphaerota bacterium ZTH]